MATTTIPEVPGLLAQRRARAARRAGIGVLAAFLVLGILNVFGVRSGQVSSKGSGYELTVTYAEVSRPGLATPWQVEVRKDGGFDGPISIGVDPRYMAIFDENGLDPDPAAATSTPEMLIWEFDPPTGDTLTVSFDGRIEPALQWGRDGAAWVLVDGVPVTGVRFRTEVMP